MDWAEQAEDELHDQLNDGDITQAEFNRYMRELREEARESGDYN